MRYLYWIMCILVGLAVLYTNSVRADIFIASSPRFNSESYQDIKYQKLSRIGISWIINNKQVIELTNIQSNNGIAKEFIIK